MTISIFIVDDHPIVRAGLEATLSTDPSLTVLGQADSPEKALTQIKELAPEHHVDVVLMDLQFGSDAQLSGAEGTALIRQLPDAPQVLVITTYATDADILPAIQAGAVGYILKDSQLSDLTRAIHTAAQGKTTLSPAVAQRLFQRTLHTMESLTSRELEVLQLVANGYSNKKISELLFLTEGTVKTHLTHIYTKLQATSRTEAVSKAQAQGIISSQQ